MYVVALPTELLSQVIKYSSVGSAVAFLGQTTFFEGRRPSEKRAKFLYFERYSPVSYSSDLWCMEGLIK